MKKYYKTPFNTKATAWAIMLFMGLTPLFLQAGNQDRASNPLERDSKSSTEPEDESLYDQVKQFPQELQMHISGQMPLVQLLEVNKNASDVLRGSLQTGPCFTQTITEQFYQTIDSLLATAQQGDISDQFDKVEDAHIQNLMDILTALHDYEYYGFNNVIYQATVLSLQNHPLWTNPDFQALYNPGYFSALSKKYKLIQMLLGQILNHIDPENKKRVLRLESTCLDSNSMVITNVVLKLILHANNQVTDQCDCAARKNILYFILDRPEFLTIETCERIASYVDTPRPKLYRSPGAIARYALKYPGQNLRPIRSFGFQGPEVDSQSVYDYLSATKSLDQELVSAMISQISDSIDGEMDRCTAFEVYIKRSDATPENMEAVIDRTLVYNYEMFKFGVYEAYMRHTKATSKNIIKILKNAQTFCSPGYKNTLYQTYMRRADADEAIIKEYNMRADC